MAQTPGDSIPNTQSAGAQSLNGWFNDTAPRNASTTASPAPAGGGLNSWFEQPKPDAAERGAAPAYSPISAETLDQVATVEGLTPRQRQVMGALLEQESGSGRNAKTSIDGARGAGQIMPDTFRRYAKQGERIDDPASNLAVAARIIKDLGSKSGDDPARIATGYFSGSGNVNSGAGNAWRNDAADGNGKRVSSYVGDVLARLTGSAPAAAAEVAAPAAEPFAGAPKWSTVIGKPEYKALPAADKQAAREAYFQRFVAPSIPEDQRAAYRQRFDENAAKLEPAETSNLADAGKSLKIGANIAAQDVRELVGRIPLVGESLVRAGDAADRYLNPGAKDSDALLKADTKAMQDSMSPEMRAAGDKKWWDSDKGTFGDAWADPRSYASGVLQSLPEQAITMFPAMKLAKFAYSAKLAGGATQAAAAATAARTAGIAGALSEGALGGAQSAREVRDQVLALPDQTLQQSDAFKQLLSDGMTPVEAKTALAEDLSTRAFVTAGTVTGLFGGMGDRAIAKIFTEQVSKPMLKRVLGGAAKGFIGEGLLEELPQSAGQQLAQNEAIGRADPNKKLSDDVLNQALGGFVQGGLQGGVMGGGAAALNREAGPAPAAPADGASRIEPTVDSGDTPAAPPAAAQAAPRAPGGVADQDVLDYADSRYRQLVAQRDGEIGPNVGEDGAVVEGEQAGAGLSEADAAELALLQQNRGDAAALARQYGFDTSAPTAEQVAAAANEAATSPENDRPEPTQAQKEAGNYKKGSINLHGLDLAIENPQNSSRSGVSKDGRAWSRTLADHYGYVRGTVGADGDGVDVFVGPHPQSTKVFVIDQIDPDTGRFDEHKALLGYDSLEAAERGYLANYESGWNGIGNITEVPADGFKAWLNDGDTTKPFGDGQFTAAAGEVPEAAALVQRQRTAMENYRAAAMSGDEQAAQAAGEELAAARVALNTARINVADRAQQMLETAIAAPVPKNEKEARQQRAAKSTTKEPKNEPAGTAVNDGKRSDRAAVADGRAVGRRPGADGPVDGRRPGAAAATGRQGAADLPADGKTADRKPALSAKQAAADAKNARQDEVVRKAAADNAARTTTPEQAALISQAVKDKLITPGGLRGERFRAGIIDATNGVAPANDEKSYVEGHAWALAQQGDNTVSKPKTEKAARAARAEKAAPKPKKTLADQRPAKGDLPDLNNIDRQMTDTDLRDLGMGFTVVDGKLLRNGDVVGRAKVSVDGGGKVAPHVRVADLQVTRKGNGVGTMALAAIMGKASQFGLPVALTTEAGLGKAHQVRLRGYYERMGFRKNTGVDKINGISEEYVWQQKLNNIDIPTGRKALQAAARAMGLRPSESNEVLREKLLILQADPRTWSEDDLKTIAYDLDIHQDTRDGSTDRAESVMTNGLPSGMTDNLGAVMNGGLSWAKKLHGGDVYLFLSRNLQYASPTSGWLAPGNIPLIHFKAAPNQKILEAINQTAVRNNATKNPLLDIDLKRAGPLARESEPVRVNTLAKLKALEKKLATGKLTDAEYQMAIQTLIGKLETRNEAQQDKRARDRERGELWLRERLLRAKRLGELAADQVDFALWALDTNPAIANDLGISLRESKDDGVAGSYIPGSRIISLVKGNGNMETVVHEIMHHTERMMPPAVQQGIVREWSRAIGKAWKNGTPAVRAALSNMMLSSAGDKKAYERMMDAFRDGTLTYDDHYQLVNASEYWAVNASDILGKRADAAGRWVAQARQWLREMVEQLKGLLNLPSSAPVLSGLEQVMEGNGNRLSGKMLVELSNSQAGSTLSGLNDIDTKQTSTLAFKNWFGKSKVVGTDGKPLVVYHGSRNEFTTFDYSKIGQQGRAEGAGFYFTNNESVASGYGTAMKVYLSIQKPMAYDEKPFSKSVIAKLVKRIAEIEAKADGTEIGDGFLSNFGDVSYDGLDSVVREATNLLVNEETALDQLSGIVGSGVNPEYVNKATREITGYDGVVAKGFSNSGDSENTIYVAFFPEQIKSATDNSGEFDPSDPSILNNIDLRTAAQKAQAQLVDEFGKPTFTNIDWWDKSIGTQYHKAAKNPLFKKVFDLAIKRENAVSLTAVRPASLAPGFLPRIDDFMGAMRTLAQGRRTGTQTDLAGKALLEGTLAGTSVIDGKVWTSTELRAKGLNDQGIALYQQAREAIDASLDEVAAAEGYSTVHSFVPKSIREDVIDDPRGAQTVLSAALAKRIQLDELHLAAQQSNGASPAAVDAAKNKLKQSYDVRDTLGEIFERAKQLKAAGYTPLMRFGNYYVQVEEVDPATGKTVIDPATGKPNTLYFSRFETEAEASDAYFREQVVNRGKANIKVSSGPVNDEAFKMFAGISPETLELFAKVVGAKEATEKFYQEALSERSALKRRITRNSTEGYSENMPRVLANFITSNGKFSAQRYYNRDINNAIRYIPRLQGDVQKEAIRLKEYIDNPGNTGAIASALSFTWFLGGNIASALINATQPVMMTLPYLSQFGASRAAAALTRAAPYAMGRKQIMDADLKAALKRGAQEGKVDAQEIFHLYSVGIQGVASILSGKLSKLPLVGSKVKGAAESTRARMNALGTLWGMPFAMIEGFNRRLTFIAAWDVAKATGQVDPYAFAVDAVDQTQGVYNKVNRPNWARGPVGRVVFTFAQFKIMNVEMIKRLSTMGGPEGKKAAAMYLAVLILMAGLAGVPYADDIDDIIDTAGQWLGYNTNMKRTKREWAYKTLGQGFGDLALYGISSHLPVDVGGRMGLGNFFPATGILKPSGEGNRAQDIMELGGPAVSGLGRQVFDAYDAASMGNYGKAAMTLMPTAVKNAATGVDMAVTGKAKDMKGRVKTDVTPGEGFAKGIGLNPTVVAEKNRANMPINQDLALQRLVESSIVDQWAQGAATGNQEDMDAARKRMETWNRKNPETPVAISAQQIRAKVKTMLTPTDARLMKGAPKEMRGRVAEGLKKED